MAAFFYLQSFSTDHEIWFEHTAKLIKSDSMR